MQEHEEKEVTNQADPQNIHHEDLALKTAAQYFGEELLPLLGITDNVRYVGSETDVPGFQLHLNE